MDALKKDEELKRERASDPVLRWKNIQETISWAEANMKPELRRNRPRWHKHEKGIAGISVPHK